MNPIPQDAERPDPVAAVITALMAASGAAQCVIDADSRCVAATDAFARAAGRPMRDLVGRAIPTLPQARVVPLDLGDGHGWWLVELPPADAETATLRSVLDHVPAMINAKDRDSRYLWMNAYQAGLYGVRPDQAVGRTAAEMLGRGYGSYTRSRDAEVIENERPIGFFEESYAGVDGKVRDWLTAKVPFRNPLGRVAGVVTLAVDITERREREESLTVAKQQAEEGARARARYLATVGHELRTPLHSIVGFSEFLAHESLGPLGNPVYKEYVTDILSAGRHLLDVVGDVMDMAQLEAGRMPLAEDLVDVERTVLEVLRMVALPLSHGRLRLVEAVPEGLPHLHADPRRVRQILVNLLSNAIKYTPEGGSVGVSAGVDAGGDLVVSVTDTGIGIAPEHMAMALAPFGRVSGTTADGTGLGLPLVKALLEAHGGRLELESAPNRGTTARAVFPKYRLRTPA